jgi:bifunctional non-homologous end joining protein LigD
MFLERKERLAEGADWPYEIKLDGYRALAIKNDGGVALRSRNDNDFSRRYPTIVKALTALPDETVMDGEVVALDETGKPSFNVLQNYGSSPSSIFYYAFDVLLLGGRDVMSEPLAGRRALLESRIPAKLRDPVRYSVELKASLPDLIASVKAQPSRGLSPKDAAVSTNRPAFRQLAENAGEPGAEIRDRRLYAERPEFRRAHYRILRKRETVLRRPHTKRLHASAAGGTHKAPSRPADRDLANLPEMRTGRWGQGLTAAKMKECRGLRPALVGQFEFVEWTADLHLRHTRFIAARRGRLLMYGGRVLRSAEVGMT